MSEGAIVVAEASLVPLSARLRAYPWTTALLLGICTALGYYLLPELAPSDLSGEVGIFLLGIVLGLAVGVATRVRLRLVPAMSVGAALGVLAYFSRIDTVEFFVIFVALVIGVELYLMTYLLRRTGAWLLQDQGDVLRYALVVLAVTVPMGLAVTLAALVEQITFDAFIHSWRSWVLDGVFGLVVIAPAIITLRRPRRQPWGRVVEFLIAAAYTAASTYYIFFVVTPGEQGLIGWPYLVVIGTIWIAVRLGLRAVAPVVALQFWFAVVGTVNGSGAFAGATGDAVDRLLVIELFSIVMAATIISLAVLRDGRLASLARVRGSSLLLREVIDGSAALIFAKSYAGEDADKGRYVLVNRTWGETTGIGTDETVGRSDADIFPADAAEAFLEVDQRVMETGEAIEVHEVNADAFGIQRQYLSSKFPLLNEDGSVWGVGGIATDVTEVILAQERERRQAELLHAVFELSPTPAVRLTLRGGVGMTVRAANAAMCALLGAPTGRIEDCNLMDHVHPEDASTALDVLTFASEAADRPGPPMVRQRELRMRTMDGRTVWVLMSAASVRGLATDETEIVAQFEDFTARRAAEVALSDQALRDVVTGLPNRRALHERVDSALQRLRRRPGMVTVLFCDLDHFKDVNDSLGHAVGDRLLVEVAERLKSAIRPEDTIARLGGDEFVALGEGITDPADAVLLAIRLQDKLSAPWMHDQQVFRPAMSIGIAMTSDADVTVDELLRRADLAMYRAKESGRNRIELYERSVDDEVQHAVSMQHELRRAIDTGGLVLHYQPIVQLDDGAIVGAEALVRLRLADGSLLGPVNFVPQAEATGLVVPMGAWVIQQALVDLIGLRERRPDLTMSINVSPAQLREEGFARYLLEQARFAGVDASWLSLEVTETALIHDPGRSGRELAELHDAGIRVSLDDFGTGYSSLSWLTQFPVNVVKIDKSFTDDIGIDERKSAIVSAVIAVSHELGFTVVAEGIESAEQSRRLLELGCDRGQGYLYGKPTPIEEPPWM